jgi:tetratricopeptide (TPR) repeat protein
VVLGRQGKLAEAEAANRQALRLRPDYADAHNGLGVVLELGGNLPEAETAFREAIRHKPGFALAHNNCGLVLERQGKLSEAEAAYKQAIHFHPGYAEAHYNLGGLLRRQDKQGAEAAFREAIRHKQDYAEAYNNLGVLLERRGKSAEAEAAYRKALHFKRDLAEAHMNLAWLLATYADPRSRKPREAIASAERAVMLAPNNAYTWRGLGAARYRSGDYQAAIAALDKARSLRKGGDSFDWFFLAMAHGQLGDRDKARRWYDSAVSWMEKHRPESEVLQRLRAEAEKLLEIKRK